MPNLDGINDLQVIKEFFNDKHMYHFEEKTLENLLNDCNFEIADNYSDDFNIVLTTNLMKTTTPVLVKTKIT